MPHTATEIAVDSPRTASRRGACSRERMVAISRLREAEAENIVFMLLLGAVTMKTSRSHRMRMRARGSDRRSIFSVSSAVEALSVVSLLDRAHRPRSTVFRQHP